LPKISRRKPNFFANQKSIFISVVKKIATEEYERLPVSLSAHQSPEKLLVDKGDEG
jgi:hypothetical protein